MRKKLIAMIAMVVMAVTMLAGCGGPSAKDYQNDLDVLTQAANAIDETDFSSGESFSSKISGLSCKTDEGKALLADFVSMGAIYDEMSAAMSGDDYDSDAVSAAMDKMTALQDTFEQHLTAFKDAATAVGVDASQFEASEDVE